MMLVEEDVECLALSATVQEMLNNNKHTDNSLVLHSPSSKRLKLGDDKMVTMEVEDTTIGEDNNMGTIELLVGEEDSSSSWNDEVSVEYNAQRVPSDSSDDIETDDVECLMEEIVVGGNSKSKEANKAKIMTVLEDDGIIILNNIHENKPFNEVTVIDVEDSEESEDDCKNIQNNFLAKDCFVSITRTAIPASVISDVNKKSPKSTCNICGQMESRVTPVIDEGGVAEGLAVKDERICVVSWDDAVKMDFPPTFRVSDVSIYDQLGHLVPFDQGLVEAGHPIYFCGTLMNVLDSHETVRVKRAGPIMGWRRHEGEEDGEGDKLVLTTEVEGMDIEYIIDMEEFNVAYKTALHRLIHYNTFFDALTNMNKPLQKQQQSQFSPKSRSLTQSQNPPKSRRPPQPQYPPKSQSPLPKLSVNRTRKLSGSSDKSWTPDSPPVFKSRPSKSRRSSIMPTETKTHNTEDLHEVLRSLDHKPGVGEKLRSVSSMVNYSSKTLDAAAAFLLFIKARQDAWVNKYQGNDPLTTNKVIGKQWFTNIYRELDRGTAFFKMSVMPQLRQFLSSRENIPDLNLVSDILFKSIVYRLINKVETFTRFGGLPSPSEFDKFLTWIHREKDAETVIFTAAHQNMGFRRLMDTFSFVSENITGLTKGVMMASKMRSTKRVLEALLTIPNVGNFFAWQILCDLTECKLLDKCTDNQWTVLGPGAKSGLRRIFDMESTKHELYNTRILRDLCTLDGEQSGFSILGVRFQAFLGKRLSLKNVEHGLCEFDKYFRYAVAVPNKARLYTDHTSRVGLDKGVKCGHCEKVVKGQKWQQCPTCYMVFHKDGACLSGMVQHKENIWLCGNCDLNCQLWDQEEFEHDEVDDSDEVGKVYVNPAAARNRTKVNKGLVKNIKPVNKEYVTLSSDEECEEEDEVEFLAEMESHYFGYESGGDISNASDASIHDDDSDPFADVQCWVADVTRDKDESDDDEILILS